MDALGFPLEVDAQIIDGMRAGFLPQYQPGVPAPFLIAEDVAQYQRKGKGMCKGKIVGKGMIAPLSRM